MKKITLLSFIVVAFIACSKNEKKIIVLNKGTAVIDVSGKTITLKDGGGNQDQEMYYNSANAITLQVKGEKEMSIDIPDNGYYILNLKNDTIIGSRQNFVNPETLQTDTFRVITQEVIKKSVDSLIALTEGKNVSEANQNYFILPYTAVKVTNNVNATIIAPYHNIRSIEQNGKEQPEVYRFYSIKEVREKIEKQKALMVPQSTK